MLCEDYLKSVSDLPTFLLHQGYCILQFKGLLLTSTVRFREVIDCLKQANLMIHLCICKIIQNSLALHPGSTRVQLM